MHLVSYSFILAGYVLGIAMKAQGIPASSSGSGGMYMPSSQPPFYASGSRSQNIQDIVIEACDAADVEEILQKRSFQDWLVPRSNSGPAGSWNQAIAGGSNPSQRAAAGSSTAQGAAAWGPGNADRPLEPNALAFIQSMRNDRPPWLNKVPIFWTGNTKGKGVKLAADRLKAAIGNAVTIDEPLVAAGLKGAATRNWSKDREWIHVCAAFAALARPTNGEAHVVYGEDPWTKLGPNVWDNGEWPALKANTAIRLVNTYRMADNYEPVFDREIKASGLGNFVEALHRGERLGRGRGSIGRGTYRGTRGSSPARRGGTSSRSVRGPFTGATRYKQ